MQRINIFKKNKVSFSIERVICRLLAAWSIFTAYGLIKDSNFSILEYAQHTSLWYMFLFVGLLFIVFSCVNILAKNYETDTWFLMFGASTCVVCWLFSYENKFLFSLAVVVAFCLFVVYFVHKNKLFFEKWQPGNRTIWSIAIIFGVFSGLVIGAITCYRHLTFSAPNFDFGIFVNMFHNMKETGVPSCTCERDVLLSHFVVHLSPIYYVLLPFYMLFPSPLTLQIGQAVVLASGVIPVVLLCKHFKVTGKLTMLVTLIYALYPALTTGCFYDIHENCFLTPLLLWLFCFFEQKKYVGMYIFAALILLVKEDAAIYIVFFALYVLFARKRYRHGIFLIIGSLAYFAIALTALKSNSTYYAELYINSTPNPAINGPMINRFNNLIFDSSDGLAGAIKTVLFNPGYLLTQLFTTGENDWEKVSYFIKMFLPIGFIPFFTNKPSRWLLICPILMNLVTNYIYQYDLRFQYHFGVSAFLIYAVINNLPDLKLSVRRNVISVAVAACCCLYITSVFPTLQNNLVNWKEHQEKYTQMERILETIPEDASVCCSTFLVSHLADRDEIYELNYHDNAGDVDYVVFDARYAVDNEQIDAFLDQGYVVKEEYKNMLIVLVKNEN